MQLQPIQSSVLHGKSLYYKPVESVMRQIREYIKIPGVGVGRVLGLRFTTYAPPPDPNVQSLELIQMMNLIGAKALIYASKHDKLVIFGGKSAAYDKIGPKEHRGEHT